MEARRILLLEQVFCRVPYHVFETLDKTNREAKYTAEPGHNDIGLCDTSPIASDIPWHQQILRR
jgi:hypothetical protein